MAADQAVVTLVNVFTVNPEHQQELADLLVEATQSTMNRFPGYVSANIHRSDLAAQQHMAAATRLAISAEPHLYQVVFTDHAGEPARP